VPGASVSVHSVVPAAAAEPVIPIAEKAKTPIPTNATSFFIVPSRGVRVRVLT
jgi:hypothetical protein